MKARDYRKKGQLIRSLRAHFGMTQLEFALALGISCVTVVFWEKGRTFPRREMLFRIYSFLQETCGKEAEAWIELLEYEWENK